MKFLVAIAAVLLFFAYLGHRDWDARANADAKAATPANDPRERQFQAVLRAGAGIRAAMRNPQSLVYSGVWANADASLICFQYRAQNGFGGMNIEQAVVQNGKLSQTPSDWNKNCVSGPIESMDVALHQLNR